MTCPRTHSQCEAELRQHSPLHPQVGTHLTFPVPQPGLRACVRNARGSFPALEAFSLATQTVAINVSGKCMDYGSTVCGWPQQTLRAKAPSYQKMSLLGHQRRINDLARSDSELEKVSAPIGINGFSAICGDGRQDLNPGPSCYCDGHLSPRLSFLTYEVGIRTLLPVP